MELGEERMAREMPELTGQQTKEPVARSGPEHGEPNQHCSNRRDED
jgi:hypothetical protein